MNAYKFVWLVWIRRCFISTAAARYSNLETRYITKLTTPRAEKLATCAISFVKFVFVSCTHRIVSRMIDGVVLLSENLAPTYSVYVPSKFVTARTLASRPWTRVNSKQREREREKFSKRRLRIPPTWFTPLTPVDFQRVTGLTRESRPNTGRLTKFRVNTMMHRLIHPNCAQNTRRARRAIPTARLRKRRKCATGLKPRYTPINSPCTMTNISWISCSKAVTYFLLYETRLFMTDINY